ncbi:hypothetical protein T484DRAFT_1754430 [Baffinella frigidus]|nr:hypothetical protein T484DRAFT_1754430 [Cryptophyta sp. CCMP2293]
MTGIEKWGYRPPSGKGRQEKTSPPASLEPVAAPSQRPSPTLLNHLAGALGPVAPSIQRPPPTPYASPLFLLNHLHAASRDAQIPHHAGFVRDLCTVVPTNGSSVPGQPIAQVTRALALLQTESGAHQHHLGLRAARSGGCGA